jgi:hypothetical protein
LPGFGEIPSIRHKLLNLYLECLAPENIRKTALSIEDSVPLRKFVLVSSNATHSETQLSHEVKIVENSLETWTLRSEQESWLQLSRGPENREGDSIVL